MGFHNQLAGNIQFTFLKQRIANLVTFSFEERVGHTAADQQAIDDVDEPLQHCYLVGDFSTADDRCKGSARVFQGRSQEVYFLLHKEACNTREIVCYALG